jgi:hypothetical protein
VTVHALEIGLRACFYWLSDDAERSMGAEERAAWMEASGKGHCQDAAASVSNFAGCPGTVFAGARSSAFLCAVRVC